MTVIITGTVVVSGVRYPCEAQIELPDSPARGVSPAARLKLVPKAG